MKVNKSIYNQDIVNHFWNYCNGAVAYDRDSVCECGEVLSHDHIIFTCRKNQKIFNLCNRIFNKIFKINIPQWSAKTALNIIKDSSDNSAVLLIATSIAAAIKFRAHNHLEETISNYFQNAITSQWYCLANEFYWSPFANTEYKDFCDVWKHTLLFNHLEIPKLVV